jgi:hypothetical protein
MTDDVRSSVRVEITLYPSTGPLLPFDGTAKLATDTNSTPPLLTRSGDWLDASRDGDFTVVSCTRFSCQIDVDATISLPDTLNLPFGESFAVEVALITTAHIFQGNEVEAEANFFNTANVTLSTDTPGVTIDAVIAAPEVPALGFHGQAVSALFMMACAAQALRTRRLR